MSTQIQTMDTSGLNARTAADPIAVEVGGFSFASDRRSS
jgi:hypothetical protein